MRKLAFVLLFVSFNVFGQHYTPILITPYQARPLSSVTITPQGPIITFQAPRGATTITPQGTFITFYGNQSATTIGPQGQTYVTFTQTQRPPP